MTSCVEALPTGFALVVSSNCRRFLSDKVAPHDETACDCVADHGLVDSSISY